MNALAIFGALWLAAVIVWRIREANQVIKAARRDFVPTAGPDVASAAAGETASSSPPLGEVNNP